MEDQPETGQREAVTVVGLGAIGSALAGEWL